MENENLPVANSTRPREHGNVFHHFVTPDGVADQKIDSDFGKRFDLVFPSTVDLGMASLPTHSLYIGDAHRLDTEVVEKTQCSFEAIGTEDECDQFHFKHKQTLRTMRANMGGAGSYTNTRVW